MKTWVAAACGLLLGVACSVRFTDDVAYTCKSDADCGGDGFVCTARPGGAGACCKKTGDVELCDGRDNDCDGLVDGADTVPAETCNGADDDCDGQTDEDFDLRADRANCGRCGNVCTTTQACMNGTCVIGAEVECNDGVDNDMNGKKDCEELSCNLASCGVGCQCQALKKAERNCNDALDNDGDLATDCADDNCAGAGCGDGGCFCDQNRKKEADCRDGRDNDDDMQADCADSDCGGQLCQQGPSTFRCAGAACVCNDGGVVTETGVRCRDFVDNDCDGLVDCQEADCNAQTCNPDGGLGCLCSMGKRTETNCGDRVDNDQDGTTDCADTTDCPSGTLCTYLNPGGMVRNGNCSMTGVCQ